MRIEGGVNRHGLFIPTDDKGQVRSGELRVTQVQSAPAEDSHIHKSEPYQSFLLRIWRAGNQMGCWRASLDEMGSGRRLGFPSLEELFAFLMDRTESEDRKEADSETADSVSVSRSTSDEREG